MSVTPNLLLLLSSILCQIGITEPLLPATFPYLTTENTVPFSPLYALAAINSLSELEKKMGTAPVNDYDFGEYAEDFNKDHEAFKELTAYAKEKRVPQEVFTKMLESVSKYAVSLAPNLETEKAKIGQDADRRIEQALRRY